MKKRKVLFLIESLAGGGAEKVLTTLVQHINKEKFDVMVCAISGGGKYEEIIKEYVAYKAILNEPQTNNVLARLLYTIKHHLVYKWLPLSWVYQLFVPQGNDVEVAYVEGFTTKLLSHSTNRKAKKYSWVHCNMEKDHWTTSVYKNIQEEVSAYDRYTKIFGVANTVMEAFQKRFPEVVTPVGTIYNPIDSSEIISQSKESVDDEIRREGTLLVSIGRLESQKAYMRLLRIMNKLISGGVDANLWILGDGTERKMLENFIEEHHLQERVNLLGFHANPYKYLRMGDLFVCSSLSEGYSTAVTEALILGLPVITTNCSGMAELLKDGECGMITGNNEEALYTGLKQLLSDGALLKRYRQMAVERGKEFSIAHLMEPIEHILL